MSLVIKATQECVKRTSAEIRLMCCKFPENFNQCCPVQIVIYQVHLTLCIKYSQSNFLEPMYCLDMVDDLIFTSNVSKFNIARSLVLPPY